MKSEIQKSIESFEKEKSLKPSSKGWNYVLRFGIINVESWGKPYLIVNESKFYNGKSWGNAHYKIGIEFESSEEALKMKNELNEKYSFPEIFSSAKSEVILLKIQNDFPSAEIKK